jgi:hypothetical protein
MKLWNGLLLGLMALVFSGCAAENALNRASGFSEAFVTKGLDKLNPDKILADAMVDATNPQTEGNAEVYQAWGVRWRNQYTGIIARGNLHMSGAGGPGDDPELRQLIREKLGDPWLKSMDDVLGEYRRQRESAKNQKPAEGNKEDETALPRSAP